MTVQAGGCVKTQKLKIGWRGSAEFCLTFLPTWNYRFRICLLVTDQWSEFHLESVRSRVLTQPRRIPAVDLYEVRGGKCGSLLMESVNPSGKRPHREFRAPSERPEHALAFVNHNALPVVFRLQPLPGEFWAKYIPQIFAESRLIGLIGGVVLQVAHAARLP
jgi:hypothetical protein